MNFVVWNVVKWIKLNENNVTKIEIERDWKKERVKNEEMTTKEEENFFRKLIDYWHWKWRISKLSNLVNSYLIIYNIYKNFTSCFHILCIYIGVDDLRRERYHRDWTNNNNNKIRRRIRFNSKFDKNKNFCCCNILIHWISSN